MPDGGSVVFSSSRNGGGVFQKAADGTGDVTQLVDRGAQATGVPSVTTILPDGDLMIYDEVQVDTTDDLFLVPTDGERVSEVLLRTEFQEEHAALSPDGRWLAYTSDQSGVEQVYVRPFPNLDDGTWLISSDSGREPKWSPEGDELFYIARHDDGRSLMVADVETDPTFRPLTPKLLFDGPYGPLGGIQYDVAADGQRFLMARQAGPAGSQELVVVLNWAEELKRLVPVD